MRPPEACTIRFSDLSSRCKHIVCLTNSHGRSDMKYRTCHPFGHKLGDTCTNNNPNGERLGRCLSAYKCSWALQQIRRRQSVFTCNFVGKTTIVCCPLKQIEEEGNRTPNSTTKSLQVPTNNSINARNTLKEPNKKSSFGIISRASE
ncbi:hypothetical protein WA026_006098 [Henosepilachna vigintioctopunctata]|uniref:CLIP domain-containing serine protease n=1 Tax=Henosepilachna vigintioctopunctata TaxID=420089 RepID=A0AAW1TPL8_9CUCU